MKNRECPKCKEVGHDKKGDHLFLMKDGITWCCTKVSYHPPYYERDGKEIAYSDLGEESEVTLEEDISELGAAEIRGIPKDVVEKFGVRVEYDGATGEPTKHYYPITTHNGRNIVGWKRRILATKDFKTIPALDKKLKIDLFGMRSTPFWPRLLLITEGELDAMAAHHMMNGKFSRYLCVSLPFGASLKQLMENRDLIDGVEDVVFCPDQDDPGLEIVEKVALAFPSIRFMTMDEKDACDMLRAGKKAQFLAAIDSAKKHKPSSIVEVDDIMTEALKPIEYGLSYPWDGLTKITYGCMNRSIIGIGAAPGAGKTSLMKAIETHMVFKNKVKIGIISLEETPAQVLRSLGGYMINKPVHLPDCTYDHIKLEKAMRLLNGNISIYNHKGYRDWIDIQNTIVYMVGDGVKVVFIDPLSALVAHLSASDANTYLNHAMFSMSQLTQSMDFSIFHVNHLNNPHTGKDHGAGGAVYGSHFSGSRAMWKFSTDIWGAERDQLSEDEKVRNTLVLKLIKARLTGLSGRCYLHYNREKGILEETVPVGSFLE